MFADMSLVSWRSHSVKRFVAIASAAEVMGLSEAFAQGDWVRALWSELVLLGAGAESARMARTKRSATSHIGHGLKGQLRSLAQ